MPRILLSGYYGFGNLGDEAILEAAVGAFRVARPDLAVTVLSARPQQTAARYGVDAVDRSSWVAIWRAVRCCDLLLSGGGGLIQDATSSLSPLYYLAVLRVAQVLRRRTAVFAQGLGPVRRHLNVALTRRVFERCDAITVRDEASAQWLRSIGVRRPEIAVAADMAFLLEPAPRGRVEEALQQAGVCRDQPLIGLSVRPWGEDLAYLDHLADGVARFARGVHAQVVLLPMQPAQDVPVAARLADRFDPPAVVVSPDRPPSETLAVVGRLDLLVGMRLHALIFAACQGVPLVGLSYDPKVNALFGQLNLEPPSHVSETDAATLGEQLAAAWHERTRRRAALRGPVTAARERAQEAVSAAFAVLDRGSSAVVR